MGRLAPAMSCASAAMKPRSSPRRTSTSSKSISVFRAVSLASSAASFAAGFVAAGAGFFLKKPPMPPAGFFCSSPPSIRLDCVASPNWLSTSSPLRLREGLTSSTLNPNSSAAAYTAAVLPEPTGPHSNRPFAGAPLLVTRGAYVARDVSSSHSSHSSSLMSSSLPAFRPFFRRFPFLPPFPPVSFSLGGFATPASSAKIRDDHAASQSPTPRAAPPSHTS
mmetsp:Transcript_3801/g.16662  ORF Transcript_3801/g.16662 Transcript_3801/m.16662 type:complete len:221 (+) Transcript_3801:1015-1677(+)